MKNKPLWLFVIVALCFIAVVVICGKPAIVPNEAIGQKRNFDAWLVKHRDRMYSLLYEYEQYSAECYADSQYIETHPPAMDSDGNILGVYIIAWVWIHREPTLPGFMQFLEGKYKQ